VSIPSQTPITSAVLHADHSRRLRFVRRLIAVAAFGLFVAGLFVAAGFREWVATAAPIVGLVVAAAIAAWIAWRLRPWRALRVVPWVTVRFAGVVAFAGRGTGHAAAATGRATKRATRAAACATATTATVIGRAVATGARRVHAFAVRPREPWRPPPAVVAAGNGARCTAGRLLDRAIPLRYRIDAAWRRAFGAGVERTTVVGGRAARRVQSFRARG
jgi:hypothetical protein